MAVSVATILTVPTEEVILSGILVDLDGFGFPATAWQSGNPLRNLVQMDARAIWSMRTLTAEIVKAGLLDLSEGDNLDLLLTSQWDELRAPAVAAEWPVLLTNAPGFGPYTFPAGTFKCATGLSVSDVRFKSTVDVTVPLGGFATVTVQAEVPGIVGNVPINTITFLNTPRSGLSCNNPNVASLAGQDPQSDQAYREEARAKWGTLGTGSPESAYVYWSQNAPGAIGQVTKVKVFSNRVAVDPGLVTVVVAGPAGAVPAAVLTAVQNFIAFDFFNGKIPETAKCVVQSAVNRIIILSGNVYVRAPYDLATVGAAINANLAQLQARKEIGVEVYLDELTHAVMDVQNGLAVREWAETAPLGNTALGQLEVAVMQNNLVLVQV